MQLVDIFALLYLSFGKVILKFESLRILEYTKIFEFKIQSLSKKLVKGTYVNFMVPVFILVMYYNDFVLSVPIFVFINTSSATATFICLTFNLNFLKNHTTLSLSYVFKSLFSKRAFFLVCKTLKVFKNSPDCQFCFWSNFNPSLS